MDANILNQVKNTLRLQMHTALVNSLLWIAGKSANPQEPDWVAGLVIKFPNDLYHLLSTLIPGYHFAVTGVYCHQKPIVNFGAKIGSELGDLLILYIYHKPGGIVQRNSLLLQAKIGDSPKTQFPIEKSALHQLQLYETWPAFTYRTIMHVCRDVYPKSIHDGAQYLLINKVQLKHNKKCSNVLRTAVPSAVLSPNQSLESELIDFLKFKAGRTFDAKRVFTNR